MGDKNFHTFIDFGKNEIRACSFNKETEKIKNQFVLAIKNNQSNNISNEEKLIDGSKKSNFKFGRHPKKKSVIQKKQPPNIK